MQKEWLVFSVSLLIHAAVVFLLGAALLQPGRVMNRVEIDLEGAAMPNASLGVASPSPSAAPAAPSAASMPVAAAVPRRMAVPALTMQAPQSSSFDPDGALAAPAVGGLPGALGVPLQARAGGGGSGSGSGPGSYGGGTGRQGTGRGSALDAYYAAVRYQVDAAKRYPRLAQQRRLQGVVVVGFRLSPDGRLLGEPTVAKSSGSRLLDAAAVRAVRRGAPYPRFPGKPEEMHEVIQVPVRFVVQ
jgi:protein TonB